MIQEDTHFYLWPLTLPSTHRTRTSHVFLSSISMALLGLWDGNVEEKASLLAGGFIFLTNVLISTDKSGARHPSPKSSYPQVDSSSWRWPGQDVSMNLGSG